ncbi:prephenate dehydrogenase [Stenotrophomonas mori]|uniref:Prephenate dehydrogenase n=1 Tax=Stenotrophomonas mori TaxID=2871096 RepID=A0ABT0SE56_9GAMM|nr:prephenate dehydrogenase [Stenotrophomonas mori]MCL7713588.1 prephenate dehydrogenase [Stenotrophomonas mori]
MPVIGIVGSGGAYGRWLRTFFASRMGLEVIGHDPVDPASQTPEQLLAQADVLLFSAPIRHTPALIDDYVRRSAGREQGRLWLDVTSIKSAPVAAMLRSGASVAGLHPMTAPPKTPTLKGRVMVVCEARVEAHWRAWLERLYAALEADCVPASPEHHDRVMALVQAMVHATHLAQAGVLQGYAPLLGELRELMAYRSIAFELDATVISRILSLNPAIYEDIQFGNPHAGEVLDRLLEQLQRLRALLADGSDAARSAFRGEFLEGNRDAMGEQALRDGNYNFERLGYLLSDLADARAMSVHLPEDRAGSLRELLHVFERHGISLASIHSSRTPAGDVHFRMGFARHYAADVLDAAAQEIDRSGIGRVLER